MVSEVDLFLRLCPALTVGVTGTKGKTTTSALIAAVLAAGSRPVHLGGNIGTPLVERLPEMTAGHTAVLELSELQLPTLSRGTDVSVYTHVTGDHLDRHGTLAAYRSVKRLLAELAPLPDDRRAAYYVCTAAVADPDGNIRAVTTVTGEAEELVSTLRAASAGVLLSSVETILKNKPLIESKMKQLVATPVGEHAAALGTASEDMYTNAVTRIEQARLMLSVYAVVLLLSVGFIALRLQRTYHQINRANAELAVLNESLEHRVADRTNELSGTLADLKESQVQLVQAEKMSSLGQLVAGISHEINTPLLYLANNAELIRERLEPLRDFVSA